MKKNSDWIFLVILGIILFGIFWKTLTYELVWDDKLFDMKTYIFQKSTPLTDAFRYGWGYVLNNERAGDVFYRPLLTLSFMLENRIWGFHPFSLKLVNLLLYLLALAVAFAFFKRQAAGPHFAEMATMLFALFPINVENIIWVVGRGDLLMILSGVLALLFLQKSIETSIKGYLALSSAAFLFGLLCKETTVFFLPAFFIYEFITRKRLSAGFHVANLALVAGLTIFRMGAVKIINMPYAFEGTLLQNLKTAISAAGYYVRTLVFPFNFAFFSQLKDIEKPLYIIIGSLGLLGLLYLLVKTLRNRELLAPWFLIATFLGAQVIFAFSIYFPYKIYSRYMMVPALGLAWLVAACLSHLKGNRGLFAFLAILIFFIPSVVINAYSYKDDLGFWENASTALPHDSYPKVHLAQAYFNKRNFLQAEICASDLLSLRMTPQTARILSFLYADIDFVRKDYAGVSRWMSELHDLYAKGAPGMVGVPVSVAYGINARAAAVLLSQGDIGSAERILKENIALQPQKTESYEDLYSAYVGFEKWEEAHTLENQLKTLFASSYTDLDTDKIRVDFNSGTHDYRAAFYATNRNYKKALDILIGENRQDAVGRLTIARLYYSLGNTKEAEKVVLGVAGDGKDTETLNTIANFYLNDLARVKEALEYFRRSLALNENQPDVRDLVSRLEADYLKKVINPWEHRKNS